MKKPELLAPAGDMACLKAAINAGADAVYLGGEEYGARAYASNFSQEELCEAVCYAHLFGVKVYLTVNTLVKEREFSRLVSFIKPFYDIGLDGVIIQDLGVLQQLKDHFPGLKLHASTQMCVTNVYGAQLLKDFGVTRIVPARELSIGELLQIKDEVDIEMECFIHGAMCYCYSGQCLYSSFLGGRSGNRGRCAGPCRLPYQVYGSKDVYPLSLKDMCTISMIGELIDAGIDSFKIEGRMKNPYYVAGVTSIYRKYIDLYFRQLHTTESPSSKNPIKIHVSREDMDLLNKLYVRTSLQDGYFHRHNGKEMITMQKPGYALADEKEFLFLKENFLEKDRKVKIYGELQLKMGKPVYITVWDDDGHHVCITGDVVVNEAQNRPVQKEDVLKQINKTGNTPFYFETLSVIMDDNVFIVLKALNEIRRKALLLLKEQIVSANKPENPVQTFDVSPKKEVVSEHFTKAFLPADEAVKKQGQDTLVHYREGQSHLDRFRISCQSLEQLHFIIDQSEEYSLIDALEINAFLLKDLNKKMQFQLKALKEKGIGIYLVLPPVFRKKASDWLNQYLHLLKDDLFDGFYCNGVDALSYIQSVADIKTQKIMADYSLYTCNKKAVEFLQPYHVSGYVVPYELTYYEWLDVLHASKAASLKPDSEYPVYGHVPFMRTANCVKKTFDRCDKVSGITVIKDRTNKDIAVCNQCEVCENTIYNGVVLSLHQEVEKICSDYLRISFTIEKKEEMKQVLDVFLKNQDAFVFEYTKGHFKKGIE